MVARVAADSGQRLATIVNYACHPTTLAWDNRQISPDYVGALRETIERETRAACVFLQGASGDLGPREGFVGNLETADRNGRQLAYAALSALEAIPSAGTAYAYQGPVISGTSIGTWAYVPLTASRTQEIQAWQIDRQTVELPYRDDLPSLGEAQRQLQHWQQAEAQAALAGDNGLAVDCRARAEQMTRQIWRQQSLPAGHGFPLPFTLARLGDAFWLFVPGEHYQSLQTALRARFPQHTWIVSTITGGWQPGYIPPAGKFGRGIYQADISVVASGSAELLLEAITARAAALLP
jgi:hypothetical protein